MKIGILADCLGLGFAGGVRRAAELGADGVQLYAVEGELAPENMSSEKRAWARRIVRDAGIEISAICGDLGEGGFAFAEKNRGKIDYTKKIVELAVDLGCRIVTTHIGVVPHDVNHPRFQVIADALRELLARSELIIQKRTKRKELADVDIAPMIGKVELSEEPHLIRGTVTVRAQNPGLNPQLLEKAIAKYRPDLQPDFMRVRRLAFLDEAGNNFR